jgi:hypothetical protein
MSSNIVGLVYDPWRWIREAPTSFRNPLRLWKKAVWYRANPRSDAYMEALLSESYPDARILKMEDRSALPRDLDRQASKVVLLYPDAIGLGFAPVERSIVRTMPAAEVEVLNGRKRQFVLDKRSRFDLGYRRFLEWTMLGEIVAGIVILAVTPVLILIDSVRVRR